MEDVVLRDEAGVGAEAVDGAGDVVDGDGALHGGVGGTTCEDVEEGRLHIERGTATCEGPGCIQRPVVQGEEGEGCEGLRLTLPAPLGPMMAIRRE